MSTYNQCKVSILIGYIDNQKKYNSFLELGGQQIEFSEGEYLSKYGSFIINCNGIQR